jgi:hypothetical protein
MSAALAVSGDASSTSYRFDGFGVAVDSDIDRRRSLVAA